MRKSWCLHVGVIGLLAGLALAATAFAGCSGAGEAPAVDESLKTAEAFLTRYYTVEEYRQRPKSAEDAAQLAEEWQPYLTQDALDAFLLNRDALRVSGAAEEAGVLLAAGKVTFEPIHGEYDYYTYTAAMEAVRAEEQGDLAFTGKIRVDGDGLVSYFAPDEIAADVLEAAFEG